VQNRVSQAAAQLPAIVNQAGIIITKKNPNILLGINLTSPDRSVDLVTLSNYVYLQLIDPLKRLPGIGDVSIFGERRYSMRVWARSGQARHSRRHGGGCPKCDRRAEYPGRRRQAGTGACTT
jgi:multidrug efflux pump subunit AcrB